MQICGSTLSFLQIEYDITFDEALKSTRDLWTFWLKNSKFKRNGGVWDHNFLPIKAPSTLGLGLFSSIVVLSLYSTLEVFATLDALTVR